MELLCCHNRSVGVSFFLIQNLSDLRTIGLSDYRADICLLRNSSKTSSGQDLINKTFDKFIIIVCLLFAWSEQSIRCAIALLNPIAVVFAIK